MKTTITLITFFLTTSLFSQLAHFSWARHIGGSGLDKTKAVKIDGNGNVIIAGSFEGSVDFDPGIGSYILTATGAHDIFVSEYDSSGNFIWARQMQSSPGDSGCAESIAIDYLGNIYLTGYFTGTVDLDPDTSTYNITSMSYEDIFILKLNLSGQFTWAGQIGGQTYENGTGITVDSLCQVYVTGYYDYNADLDPGPGLDVFPGDGGTDVFLIKLDSMGSLIWAKSLGGSSDAQATSIAVDNTGSIYIGGWFWDEADFDPISFQYYNLWSAGDADAFVSKYDGLGNLVWAKQIGSFTDDFCTDISLDGNSNILSTGYYHYTVDANPNAGNFNLSNAGGTDIYIQKLDSAGQFIWAKRMGGSGDDKGLGIAVDANNNVYSTGDFNNSVDFDPGIPSVMLISNGNTDVYFQKLNQAGVYQWAKNIGSSNAESGSALISDLIGNIYLTGYFTGPTDFDFGITDQYDTNVFDKDIFLLKISQCFPVTDTATVTSCDSYTPANTSFTWTNSGTYTYYISNLLGCDSMITVNLTIINLDNGISQLGNQLIAAAAGVNYQWLDCDNSLSPIAGETSQAFTIGPNGSYAVVVSLGGCMDTSACTTVMVSGIEEYAIPVQIYPNPTHDLIRIETGNLEHANLQLLDAFGRIVIQKMDMNGTYHQLDLSEFDSGIYILEINDAQYKFVQRIVKQ